MSDRTPRLVRIPRHLLHASLEDLGGHGVTERARVALRALIADLPLVPDASHSAVLVGPPSIGLPCLAVLARHIGQGLRDHNIGLRDHLGSGQLRANRLKLVFLDGNEVASLLFQGEPRLQREAVLCMDGLAPSVESLLTARARDGRASFVATTVVPAELGHWRRVNLRVA